MGVNEAHCSAGAESEPLGPQPWNEGAERTNAPWRRKTRRPRVLSCEAGPLEFKGSSGGASGRSHPKVSRGAQQPLGEEALQTALPSLGVRPGGDCTLSCTGTRKRIRGRWKGAPETERAAADRTESAGDEGRAGPESCFTAGVGTWPGRKWGFRPEQVSCLFLLFKPIPFPAPGFRRPHHSLYSWIFLADVESWRRLWLDSWIICAFAPTKEVAHVYHLLGAGGDSHTEPHVLRWGHSIVSEVKSILCSCALHVLWYLKQSHTQTAMTMCYGATGKWKNEIDII